MKRLQIRCLQTRSRDTKFRQYRPKIQKNVPVDLDPSLAYEESFTSRSLSIFLASFLSSSQPDSWNPKFELSIPPITSIATRRSSTEILKILNATTIRKTDSRKNEQRLALLPRSSKSSTPLNFLARIFTSSFQSSNL